MDKIKKLKLKESLDILLDQDLFENLAWHLLESFLNGITII